MIMIESQGRRSTDEEIHARINDVESNLNENLLKCQSNVLDRITTISKDVSVMSTDLTIHKEHGERLAVEVGRVAEILKLIHGQMEEVKEMFHTYKTWKGFFDSIEQLSHAAKALIPIVFLISMVTGGVVYLTMRFFP